MVQRLFVRRFLVQNRIGQNGNCFNSWVICISQWLIVTCGGSFQFLKQAISQTLHQISNSVGILNFKLLMIQSGPCRQTVIQNSCEQVLWFKQKKLNKAIFQQTMALSKGAPFKGVPWKAGCLCSRTWGCAIFIWQSDSRKFGVAKPGLVNPFKKLRTQSKF